MAKARKKKERREHGLTIWFLEKEVAEINRRKGTLPASTWVREQLLSLMAIP